MIKKILTITTIFFVIFYTFGKNTYSNNENYFIVTAYYSPLPNQSHYIMGNYEKEIRMNGKGIIGASGKKVFPGMLAAPSKYSFGTKIQLEGLGIGEVADRGGAIVEAGVRNFKYDRIDIWMGYGEEGLKRAMFWGNKKIKGTIINRNNNVNLNIKKVASPEWVLKKATKNFKFTKKNKKELYLENVNKKINSLGNLKKGDISTEVRDLQKILIKFGYLKTKDTAIFGEKTHNALIKYQIEKKVISNSEIYGAGILGPRTKKQIIKDLSEI